MKDKEDFKIVFFGTPDFATAALDSLRQDGYPVVAVVTAVDKPQGRGQKVNQSDVKKYALEHGMEILQPPNLKDPAFQEKLLSYEADLFVVVAFRMLPHSVWSMPPCGTINVHGSLLPKFRGAAPIHWAVISGEEETGVTSFSLNDQIDTGDILHQVNTPIGEKETTGDVYNRLMGLGGQVLSWTIEDLRQGKADPQPQDNSESTPAPKIYKEDAFINFDQLTINVYNFVRGMSPWPCAWTRLDDKVFKIYFANYVVDNNDNPTGSMQIVDGEMRWYTKDGYIAPTDVQMEHKKRMPIAEFLKGYRPESQ